MKKISWWKTAIPAGAAVALVSVAIVLAQSGGGTPPPRGDEGPGGEMGGPGHGHHPPPPLETALDTNKNGIIDADEIANAPASLKKLDKNGDGKLEPEEYRPQRPPRPEGQ
jgi:hypothetical protein